MDLCIGAEWPCYLSLYLKKSILFFLGGGGGTIKVYFSENSKRTTQCPEDGGAIVVALPYAVERTSKAPKPKPCGRVLWSVMDGTSDIRD